MDYRIPEEVVRVRDAVPYRQIWSLEKPLDGKKSGFAGC